MSCVNVLGTVASIETIKTTAIVRFAPGSEQKSFYNLECLPVFI